MIQSSNMDKEAEGTALCLEFFDRIFDTLNSHGYHESKKFRCPLTADSIHQNFLNDAMSALSKMSFVVESGRDSRAKRLPVSITNLIVTIRNIKQIQKVLDRKGKLAFLTI